MLNELFHFDPDLNQSTFLIRFGHSGNVAPRNPNRRPEITILF